MNAQINVTSRDRIIEVRDWMRAGTPHKAGVGRFAMSSWIESIPEAANECRTACCIAGAAAQFEQARNGLAPLTYGNLDSIRPGLSDEYWSFGDYVGDLLGLNPIQADYLFTSNMRVTPKQVATCLDRYLESGIIRWGEKEDQAVAFSRRLPTKNSILLDAKGDRTEDDALVNAVLNTRTNLIRAWRPFGNRAFRHERAIRECEALPSLPGCTPFGLIRKTDLLDIGGGHSNHVVMPDPEEYPDIYPQWYWAANVSASSSDYAWGVHFYLGSVYCGLRYDLGRALAVCRPAAASQQ